MSRPRYRWWSYVKNMIRSYPTLKERADAMKQQQITPQLTGMPRGKNGVSKPTENAALRELPRTEQRELEAVQKTIDQIRRKKNGSEILKLVKLVYWDRSHTIFGASNVLHVSERTAKGMNLTFVYKVAENYGLFENCTSEPKKENIMLP